jgi:hypothetical protein
VPKLGKCLSYTALDVFRVPVKKLLLLTTASYYDAGIDAIILKIFSPKNSAFFVQNTASKKIIVTFGFKKKKPPNF